MSRLSSRALGGALLPLLYLLWIAIFPGRVAAHPHPDTQIIPDSVPSRVLDLSALTDIDALVEKVADRRLVCVGETHDRFDHHLNQLALIKGLHRRNPDLVIAMEFFQQPYQEYLNQYIAGEIGERTLLRKTEYYTRWRFDYRLYRPILRFARAQRIPLLALNVPTEITKKVAKSGLEGLSRAERAQLPAEIGVADPAYRRRLEQVFQQHPGSEKRDLAYFIQAQLVWDEGMAAQAAEYLSKHPKRTMVLLAGSGHLEYGFGIPTRVERRVPVKAAVVINGTDYGVAPEVADYLLLSERLTLPRTGLLGVLLDSGRNSVRVSGFNEDSPAERAGLRKGDEITRLAGQPVSDYSDIRLALLDRMPGDKIKVEVKRSNAFLGDELETYDVVLR